MTIGYFDDTPVPEVVRVTWRDGNAGYGEVRDSPRDVPPSSWIGGRVIGDVTVTVADAIPDDILDIVRAKNGGLRVKLRLFENRVLLGWDIGYAEGERYRHAGGQFREAEIFNGEVVRPGWYITESGERIETDY